MLAPPAGAELLILGLERKTKVGKNHPNPAYLQARKRKHRSDCLLYVLGGVLGVVF